MTSQAFVGARAGKGFVYLDQHGRKITSRAKIDRIKSLAIPPAWTDVWISPHATGHLQATGRDAKGRKQYRYHPDWRAHQEEMKFDRLISLGEALPVVRRRIADDLDQPTEAFPAGERTNPPPTGTGTPEPSHRCVSVGRELRPDHRSVSDALGAPGGTDAVDHREPTSAWYVDCGTLGAD